MSNYWRPLAICGVFLSSSPVALAAPSVPDASWYGGASSNASTESMWSSSSATLMSSGSVASSATNSLGDSAKILLSETGGVSPTLALSASTSATSSPGAAVSVRGGAWLIFDFEAVGPSSVKGLNVNISGGGSLGLTNNGSAAAGAQISVLDAGNRIGYATVFNNSSGAFSYSSSSYHSSVGISQQTGDYSYIISTFIPVNTVIEVAMNVAGVLTSSGATSPQSQASSLLATLNTKIAFDSREFAASNYKLTFSSGVGGTVAAPGPVAGAGLAPVFGLTLLALVRRSRRKV